MKASDLINKQDQIIKDSLSEVFDAIDKKNNELGSILFWDYEMTWQQVQYLENMGFDVENTDGMYENFIIRWKPLFG